MVRSFLEFLSEETKPEDPKGKALKHLTHAEDHIIHSGHAGASIVADHLDAVHKALLGKHSNAHVSVKKDGSPSVVFGNHPQTKKFFVASKSAFNKSPKINYTQEDIEKNHGHAPGLVAKLSAALEHLPKITPHGVFQGDLMHSHGDHVEGKDTNSITPNTITYSAPKGSAEAENMKKKLGIVVHTQYKNGKDLGGMTAGPLDEKTRKQFKEHPDVNNIDPKININPHNYTSQEQSEYLNHMENAKRAYIKMKPEAMDHIVGHGPAMEAHINDMVRKDGEPSVEGYAQHITDRHNKDLEKTKTPTTATKKIQQHADAVKHIMDQKDHLQNIFDMHNHLQKAKNVLTGVMDKNSKYSHSVDGTPTNPEGYVVYDKKGNASKFVNRSEFSKLNFLKGAFQKKMAETEGV